MIDDEAWPKDPVDLQLAAALREMVARGLMAPPEGPDGYNALAGRISRKMLESPFGQEVRNLLAAFALLPQPNPGHDPPSPAESLATFVHSLALASQNRARDPSPS